MSEQSSRLKMSPDDHQDSPRSSAQEMDSVLRARIADAVTPGIHLSTYMTPQDSGGSGGSPGRTDPSRGSYFSKSDNKIPTAGERRDKTPDDLLDQFTLSDGEAKWPSLDEVRTANPDLEISGNIISATFTIPHTLKCKSGGEWVRSGKASVDWS